MKTILAIVFFFITVSAHARIGETLQECEARYGAAKSKDAKTGMAEFFKSPFRINVHFTEGKADEIYYQKQTSDEGIIPVFDVLDERDLSAILMLYSTAWKEMEITQGVDRMWTAPDYSLAVYEVLERRFLVMTSSAVTRRAKEAKDKQEEALKGL